MISLLVCDDSAPHRAALRAVLSGDEDLRVVAEAANGAEAVGLVAELEPDVVLMDVNMPVLDGVAATRRIRRLAPDTRVVALTAYDDPSVVIGMIEAGASSYCLKGSPLADLRRAIASATEQGFLDDRAVPKVFRELVRLFHREQAAAVGLVEANRRLEEEAARSAELARAVARALATAVAIRDKPTGGHIDRVTGLAMLLTARVAPELARDPRIEFGYLLHDVGKLAVPDSVLLKPAPLDAEEQAQMRAHAAMGAELVESIPEFGPVREVVRSHHERWDGTGYPDGLAGEAIPLTARLFAVCDAFDAMTSDRPHRRARSAEEALRELEAGAGTQVDPAMVREFVPLATRHVPRSLVASVFTTDGPTAAA